MSKPVVDLVEQVQKMADDVRLGRSASPHVAQAAAVQGLGLAALAVAVSELAEALAKTR